ncbi:hypothetical protein TVAG_123370 [Trichomonas vaginalis G3]|uniref:Uncharacterized protein n=1 Tax=Trichomonas vaginalis (strain ATCC PRA-98 / G3) TaxID=412133 RepID=A2FCR3_TRIV3|nr:hypothetical protein TVAG_123370 [Trichomonas vaginalis G3]|eukprot:XP_001310217.1 hypothetical protein [Trichomonas vaginalis G3]
MLPLLLLGAKAALFQTWEVGKSNRAFDFRYRTNSRTTYQNYGWRVQLRTNTTNPNDSNSNMTYTALAKNKGIIEEEGLKLEPRFDQSLGENYMRIIFDFLVNEKEDLTQSNPLSQKMDFTWQIPNACKVHFDQFQDGIGGHEVLTLHQYLIASNPFKKWEKLS